MSVSLGLQSDKNEYAIFLFCPFLSSRFDCFNLYDSCGHLIYWAFCLLEGENIEQRAVLLLWGREAFTYKTIRKDFDEQRGKEEEAENTRRQMASNRKNNSPETDYPKGLIIAFQLESMSPKDSSAENGSEVKTSDAVDGQEADAKPDSMELITEDADNKGSKNVEKSGKEGTEEENEKIDVKSSLEDKEAEDQKKSVDISPQKDEEKSKDEQKLSADVYKDNKDVVLREDLKSVFPNFGTVKYIDFKIGEDSGYSRFEEEEGGQKARAAACLLRKMV